MDEQVQMNEADQVALKYHQPGQPYVQNTPSGQEYIGITKANICMIWANPEDVENILNRTVECCGGHRKKVFFYANESDVRRWTNGGGR